MGEFDLIERYFKRPERHAARVPGHGRRLRAAAAGARHATGHLQRHAGRGSPFFCHVDPFKLGHKALAVNLSDLAACGASPLAFTLALALPRADEAWLAPFSHGLLALADAHGCELIGGDTTQGPLNICITVFGEVPVVERPLASPAALGRASRVTTSMSAARWATPGWRWRCFAAAVRARRVFTAARARLEQPDAARGAGPGPARRCHARPSTSATACWATSATSCNSRAWVPRSTRQLLSI